MTRWRGAPVRAVLFDFDGVLAETEDLHWAAFRRVAEGFGVDLSRQDYFGRYLGLPDRDCIAALLETAGLSSRRNDLDALVADKRAEYARLSASAPLYPGVAETLRRLHPQVYLAVASGAFRDEIEPVLARGGVLSLFGAIVGAAEVSRGKPAPDPFLRALADLERHSGTALGPEGCLVVEDSPTGIRAARAAGMRCVGIATSHPPDALRDADAILEHTCDLHLDGDTSGHGETADD